MRALTGLSLRTRGHVGRPRIAAGTRVDYVDLRYRNGFVARVPGFREKAAEAGMSTNYRALRKKCMVKESKNLVVATRRRNVEDRRDGRGSETRRIELEIHRHGIATVTRTQEGRRRQH